MPKPKVKLNSSGVAALLSSPGVRADLETRGARVEAAAKSSAPVASGAYRDSITTLSETHGDRAAVLVGTDEPYAFWIESSTGNLARALDAAGGS